MRCACPGAEMSLRLRLLLSLLALAAVGLVVVDAVSYGSLRSHLSQRIDQQLESARGPVTIALLGRRAAAPPPTPGPPIPLAGGRSRPAPAPAPPPAFQLPPGTYGVVRKADGRTLNH